MFPSEKESYSNIEKDEQIAKIVKKLMESDIETVLDVADHLHWGVLQFYKPSTEMIIPKKIYERIMQKCPDLLV